MLKIFTASLISFKEEAPVDKIVIFLFDATASSRGKFVMSEDEILKILNSGFKKLTASISKGVDKNSIFFFGTILRKNFIMF